MSQKVVLAERRIGGAIRTEPFFCKVHFVEQGGEIADNGNISFEIHKHAGYGKYGIERFFLPNRGDNPFFAHSEKECIEWIEKTYNVKIAMKVDGGGYRCD